MDNEYELSYLTVIYINCSRNQGINCNIIEFLPNPCIIYLIGSSARNSR